MSDFEHDYSSQSDESEYEPTERMSVDRDDDDMDEAIQLKAKQNTPKKSSKPKVRSTEIVCERVWTFFTKICLADLLLVFCEIYSRSSLDCP